MPGGQADPREAHGRGGHGYERPLGEQCHPPRPCRGVTRSGVGSTEFGLEQAEVASHTSLGSGRAATDRQLGRHRVVGRSAERSASSAWPHSRSSPSARADVPDSRRPSRLLEVPRAEPGGERWPRGSQSVRSESPLEVARGGSGNLLPASGQRHLQAGAAERRPTECRRRPLSSRGAIGHPRDVPATDRAMAMDRGKSSRPPGPGRRAIVTQRPPGGRRGAGRV